MDTAFDHLASGKGGKVSYLYVHVAEELIYIDKPLYSMRIRHCLGR